MPKASVSCLFACRWRASQLIKTIPASDLSQVRAKVAAMEMLKGQRADLGLQRAWEGNYLASVSPGEQCEFMQLCKECFPKNLQKGGWMLEAWVPAPTL